MTHHPSLGGPKWDRPDAGDQPTPSYDPSPAGYPVLPRPYGLTRPLPRRRRGYGPRPVYRQLQLLFWLVNVLVISYCLYYLWPFPPLALFGITILP